MKAKPDPLSTFLQKGLGHHQAGRFADAEAAYRQARALAPTNFDVLHLSGTLAYQQGRYDEAVAALSRAFQSNPRNASCQMRYGLALAATGRHADAEKMYRGSLQLDPKEADAWNHLAVCLKILGRSTEAVDAYRRALQLKPENFEVIDRLGALIADTQGLDKGLPLFRRAVELKPDYAPALCNLGLALISEGEFNEALSCFDRALKSDPHLTQALVGRGLAFQQSYRLEEAATAYAAALQRDPSHHEARSARLLTLNYLPTVTREQLFAEHLAFAKALGETHSPSNPSPVALSRPTALTPRSTPRDRIRLAFLSPDLRSHSVAYFLEPLLQHLNRDRFEIFLYHDHFKVDATSERLRSHATLWRNFVGQHHDVVEKQLRADAPDVLVDLAGHTGFNRLPVFARRVAPLQIGYLGYPNTTGLAAMDYRFVDAITDPDEDDQRHHTEELVRFSSCAWTYAPPATAPDIAPLAESSVPLTFGSFNNFAKVSDETLALWGRILAATPGSRLLLKSHGLHLPDIAALVDRRFRAQGIDPARVECLGRTSSLASHLALYARMDVALDTFPYHGTTTTCEALWMGVPVVSLRGNRHAARVSASLLTAIGHPDLIATTPDEYVRLSVDLANDRSRRENFRSAIRNDMQRSPLLDHAGQARLFEESLTRLIRSGIQEV